MSLEQEVRDWVKEGNVKDFLNNFQPSKDKQNYLRVVTRIYLTGQIEVSLRDTASRSLAASGGAPKPVELLFVEPQEDPNAVTIGTVADNVSKLNQMIGEGMTPPEGGGAVLPGGTVKVVAASARSVSLSETFDPPLVIGYLGFDMAILEGGELGPAIPTHAVLERGELPTARGLFTATQNAYLQVRYEAQRRADAADVFTRAVGRLGPEWCNLFNASLAASTASDANSRALEAWNSVVAAYQLDLNREVNDRRLARLVAALKAALTSSVNECTLVPTVGSLIH
jgi:hypothetical protein